MNDARTARIERLFRAASIGILILSIGAATLWVLMPDMELEPALVLLGFLYAAVPLSGRWIISRLNREVVRERMSMGYALAYGYLTNYLVPVVRRLRKQSSTPDRLEFYVYIPDTLDELKPGEIDVLLTELGKRGYEIRKVELDFEDEKRSKDFRSARRLTGDSAEKFFDIPTTLLVLEHVVDFKLETREGRFTAHQRHELGRRYIADFRSQLETMLASRPYESVRKNIRVVDGGLNFLE